MLEILRQEGMNATHQRAVSFAIARMLSSLENKGAFSSTLFSRLYGAFASDTNASPPYTPTQAMTIASTILTMAPPSADMPLALALLEPIIEKLYALLYYMESRVVSDPAEIAECKGLLQSWTKVATASMACDKLWNIFEGHGGEWIQAGNGESDELQLRWRRL
jgi:hypothetical protein